MNNDWTSSSVDERSAASGVLITRAKLILGAGLAQFVISLINSSLFPCYVIFSLQPCNPYNHFFHLGEESQIVRLSGYEMSKTKSNKKGSKLKSSPEGAYCLL